MNEEIQPAEVPREPQGPGESLEPLSVPGDEKPGEAAPGQAGKSGWDKKKDKKKESSWVRENVEAVIVAIVLALIIRQFAMEAFVIPTGSMAPTLFGEHVEVYCPNCSRRFAIDNPAKGGTRASFDRAYKRFEECPRCHSRGVTYLYDAGEWSDNTEALCQECGHRWTEENPSAGRTVLAKRVSLTCPNCDFDFQKDLTPSDITGGHKILVNKASLLVRAPKRWDIIVFKYPKKDEGEARKNYIKRLIGLPNESILIRNGDIHADGEIARKELDVIRAMSYEVFNSELPQKWEELIPWCPLDENWELSVESLKVVTHEGESQVQFDKPSGITSALPYSNPDSSTPVNDVGLRFTVTSTGEGKIFCSIGDGEHVFRFALPVGQEGKAQLLMDDIEIKTAECDLLPRRSHEVEFLNIDDRVLALLDGREVFRYDYDSETQFTESAEILLGTADTGACFEKIHVYRDIYYVAKGEHAVISPEQLSPDEYFALGDNSASSNDSRGWGTVPAQNLLGRAFIIFWPIPQVRFTK